MDPNSISDSKFCVICRDNFQAIPTSEEEKERVLECSHIFHRECIGEWLKKKHNCPVCRAHVSVDTPEALSSDMTLEEILAVPDTSRQFTSISDGESLTTVRTSISEILRLRRLRLDEDNQVSGTAAKADSITRIIFG